MGYPKQKRRPEPSAAGAAEIRVQAPPERLAAARFAHARLLKAIAAKKKSLDKLDARIDETAQRMAMLAPLRDRLVALDGEVHALFQTLLARKQLPRDDRRALATVHAFLIRAGVLAPPGWSASEAKQTFAGERETDAPRDGGGFSARRPSEAPQDQTLRALFRRLAMAMHPDRVADDAEKARRTEAMKDLSRAYADRDLARLLILERQWSLGAAGTADALGEAEREYERLEQANRELRAQLQALTAELKARKRSQ
ncbi:MAG TPA: J domain-containing protein, partial [Polyangia bacterium]|nr:J domain-containing protein [Polyangia bacterium]